jgi:hypothetical protein
MPSKRFRTTLIKEPNSSACSIKLPFDPKAAFGKARAPVKVTINKHTFRSTVFTMMGVTFVVINKENREAARVKGGDTVGVLMELDTEARVMALPKDFEKALKANKVVWARWQKLAYTHQKEHVKAIESAKKPETRVRRIEKAVQMLKQS